MSSSQGDKIEDRAFGIIGFRLNTESKQDVDDGSPKPEYLLIHQRSSEGGFWGIPKGHAERHDKSEEESAMREFCEETGIAAEKVTPWFHVAPFAQTYYVKKSSWAKRSEKLKEVKYWLAKVEANVDINVQESEVKDAAWLQFDAACKKLGFPSLEAILKQAHEKVLAELVAPSS